MKKSGFQTNIEQDKGESGHCYIIMLMFKPLRDFNTIFKQHLFKHGYQKPFSQASLWF